MKHFLYLDTDIVDSIIAQKEKGLIKESSREQQQSDSSADGTSSTSSFNGGINAGFLNLYQSKLQGTKDDTKNSERSTQRAYRNVITKTLHDAAYDIAMTYVKPTTSLVALQIGSYVSINKEFVFADFDYLESFFAKGGLYETMLTIQLSGNEGGPLPPNKQQQMKKQSKKKTDELRDICNLARGIVPYDRMLISDDGFIIPLESKYFRVTPKGMAFKYGGMPTCVGRVTNTIEKGLKPTSSDLFSTLRHNMNDTLFAILEIKQNTIYVVHPIAVYYEE